MDSRKKKKGNETLKLLSYLGICILIVGLLAIIPKVFSVNDMFLSFAIICTKNSRFVA